MTKSEYLEQKATLDDQVKATSIEAEKIAKELKRIPSPNELKGIEQFTSKIMNTLDEDLEILPADKRRVMQMLNLKILISKDGNVKLEGWFTPDPDNDNGLLPTPSIHCGRKTIHFSVNVSRDNYTLADILFSQATKSQKPSRPRETKGGSGKSLSRFL